MKIAAIVCEFNPLHNGHARLLAAARGCADAVVCVMSGSAVQRGELALIDKYARACDAVRAGADAVVELPVRNVLSGAPQFARGAVEIASLLGDDVTLMFGSECGDKDLLLTAANALRSPEVNAAIAEEIKSGRSYPTAVAAAAKKVAYDARSAATADVLNAPNNVLGIEYINAIIDTGSKISFDTIARPPYDESLAPTSSGVREAALSGQDFSASVPDFVLDSVAKAAHSFAARGDKLFALIRFLIPHMPTGIHDDSEGLSDRLRYAAAHADSLSEYLAAAKVKRYPMARIKRLTLNALICNRSSYADTRERPDFVNVLAVRKDMADAVLGGIDAHVCATGRDLQQHPDFALTARADELFESVCYPFRRNAVFV